MPEYERKGRQRAASKHATHVEWRYHLSFSVDVEVAFILSLLVLFLKDFGIKVILPELLGTPKHDVTASHFLTAPKLPGDVAGTDKLKKI